MCICIALIGFSVLALAVVSGMLIQNGEGLYAWIGVAVCLPTGL